MAQRGALTPVKRLDLAVESGGVRGTAGSYLDVSAYGDLAITTDQADLPDAAQLDSYHDARTSKPGARSCTIQGKFSVTEDTQAQWGDLVHTALGGKVSSSTLVYNAGGTQSATIGAITSGVADFFVKVSYNTGVPDYLPVKDDSGTEITYGITSRIAARTVTSIKNANQCTGAAYYEDPAGSRGMDGGTFVAQTDKGSEPDDSAWLLQGLVPSVLKLVLPTQDRAAFEFSLQGVDWDGPAYSTSAVGEMPDWDDEFYGWVCDVVIYDPATPAAFAQAGMVALEDCDLAPTWIANERQAGRTATGTVPGSAVNGWRRGIPFTKDIKLTVDVLADSWLTNRNSETDLAIAIILYNGKPSETSTKTVCIGFPLVQLNTKPTEVDVNGVVGQQISFHPRRSTTITAAHRYKCHVSFFNS